MAAVCPCPQVLMESRRTVPVNLSPSPRGRLCPRPVCKMVWLLCLAERIRQAP